VGSCGLTGVGLEAWRRDDDMLSAHADGGVRGRRCVQRVDGLDGVEEKRAVERFRREPAPSLLSVLYLQLGGHCINEHLAHPSLVKTRADDRKKHRSTHFSYHQTPSAPCTFAHSSQAASLPSVKTSTSLGNKVYLPTLSMVVL
jgi:hypothetical protein